MEFKLNESQEVLANKLLEAEKTQVGIEALTDVEENIDIDQAYYIQLHNINKKINEGETIVGKKIGLTSKAMQDLLGVNEPDYGHLLSSMVVENGGKIPENKYLKPRVEGEIAFILKEDLKGPNITALDVVNATDYIVPALEIVDSRVKDWKIKLEDTVADNASSAYYTLGGKPKNINEVDLELLGMALYKNGELMNTGVGAAALGNPINCVVWLANRLADYNITLKKGEVILSGALSAAVDAKPGDSFTARFAQIGEVTINF